MFVFLGIFYSFVVFNAGVMKFFILLICSIWFYQGYAQFSFNRGKAAVRNYYEEIPYEELKGKIITEVRLEGIAGRFIWDTGAMTVIRQGLAQKLDCESVCYLPIIDSNGAEDSLEVVILKQVGIGNTVFTGIPAIVLADTSFFMKCLQTDGMIGSNLLRNSIVQFRSKERRILMTDRIKNLNTGRAEKIPMLKAGLQSDPVITIRLKEGVNLELLFDTGDDGFLNISERNFVFLGERRPDAWEIVGEGEGNNLVGLWGEGSLLEKKYRVRIDHVGLGGAVFENVYAATISGTNSHLGADLLNYGIVTLDYRRSHFYFEPFLTGNLSFQKGKIWQVMPVFADNCLKIGLIWEDIPGISVGDEILEINGEPMEGKDECYLFLHDIIPEEAEEIELKIRTAQGEEQKVRIKVME